MTKKFVNTSLQSLMVGLAFKFGIYFNLHEETGQIYLFEGITGHMLNMSTVCDGEKKKIVDGATS